MTNFHSLEVLLLGALGLLGLETLTGTFVFLSFSAGLIAVAAVQAIFGGPRLSRDAVVFALVAIGTLVALRLTFRSSGDMKRADKDVNDY